MRTRLASAAVAAGLLLALSTVPAHSAITITFDAGVPQGPSYTEQGVTFTTTDGTDLYSTGAPDPNRTFGLIAVPTHFPHWSTLRADFSAPVDFLRVDLGDFDGDPDNLFLTAYDTSDTQIGADAFSIPDTFTGMVTLSVTVTGIDHVVFGSQGAADGTGSSVYADNFTTDPDFVFVPPPLPVVVPEPATWALLLTGFLAAGAGLRQRRRALA